MAWSAPKVSKARQPRLVMSDRGWIPMETGKASGLRSSEPSVARNGVLLALNRKPDFGFQICGVCANGRTSRQIRSERSPGSTPLQSGPSLRIGYSPLET